MLNPGTTLKAGNLRLYPHNWLEVNVVLQDKRHTVVLIDPTISQFSEDISEDIAVWYESMPGYDDAIEKYWPGEHLEAGEDAGSEQFKQIYEHKMATHV